MVDYRFPAWNSGGGGQDHGLAPAGRHDAPDGGHAQREGEVERHGAGDSTTDRKSVV